MDADLAAGNHQPCAHYQAKNFLWEVRDRVGTITLNRPDRLNAISGPMLGNLSSVLQAANIDRSVRAVILTGAGRGFCAGLAGFLLTSRLNSAEQVAGQGYELQAIAAVVIGGTSLFGGQGSMVGTLIGAMLIGVLNNGLVILNVSPYYQQIVIGAIIVLAVMLDVIRRGEVPWLRIRRKAS